MNTTCYHLVQSQPPAQTPASPPPILEWGIVITAVLSGAAYFGRWILDQAATKDKTEADLMRGLIANLQAVQAQLINDARESKLELIGHIDLKDSVSRMATLLKDDVGRALGSQGAMYAKGLENQARMESKLDALHRRQDELESKIDKLIEGFKNGSSI